jgi:hypothetical protein
MRASRTYTLGLLFFTLSWLAFDHYRPWVNFHSEMLAFVGLFWLLTNVLFHTGGSAVLPRMTIWVSFAILVPWLQYAAGISFFAGDALLSSLYLSGLFLAVFVGYAITQADTEHPAFGLMGMMHSLWIAALVSAAIGLAQWLNVDSPLGMYVVQSDVGDRAMGNLGQPNQLATLLLMGMVAFAYVFERQVIGRLAFFLGIGFMTAVLVLTQSRAGMLSVFVVTAYLMWKKGTFKSRLSGTAVALWAACFLIGTLALPYLSELLLLGDVRGIRAAEPVSQRWRMWQQIAYAVAQSPWVGYGWNQTPTAHAASALALPGPIPYSNAHNFVMDMLAWNGFPLGLLLTGAIAFWFLTRMRSSVSQHAVHAMTCLLPFAVHCMLEYPFAYAYFLIAAGFMVGIVEAAVAPAKTITVNARWAWVFLAGWVSVGVYLTYEYFLIEEDFRTVRFENLSLGKTPEAYKIPHVWMISHMGAMLKARRLVIEPNMEQSDLELLRKVSQRFADNVLHFRYVKALGLNADPVGAAHQLAIIRGMYGENYYVACTTELRRLEKEKYPQLAAVITH